MPKSSIHVCIDIENWNVNKKLITEIRIIYGNVEYRQAIMYINKTRVI